MTFLERLGDPRPILLDGATGTELNRRGVSTDLPLWSAGALLDAPATVRQIHRDYLLAGAEVVTANTFRTHRRSLARGGQLFSGERGAEGVAAIAPLGVSGLLINCTPSTTIHEPFAELTAAVAGQPAPVAVRGLYANIGHTNDIDGWTSTTDVTPLE